MTHHQEVLKQRHLVPCSRLRSH